MKTVYKCDFCDEVFCDTVETELHEEHCGYNPKNVINDKLLFRFAMIYESLTDIIACAVHDVAGNELEWLHHEADRASETNCPFTIKRHKEKMLYVLRTAQTVKRKHTSRNSCTYNDVRKEYPEILSAIVDTLKRRAWNEWDGDSNAAD